MNRKNEELKKFKGNIVKNLEEKKKMQRERVLKEANDTKNMKKVGVLLVHLEFFTFFLENRRLKTRKTSMMKKFL